MSKVYEIKVLKDEQDGSRESFFCNLCGFMLNSKDDLQSNSDYLCCQECFMTYVESRKKDWDAGWRPKKSEVRKYINKRKRLIINTTKCQEIK